MSLSNVATIAVGQIKTVIIAGTISAQGALVRLLPNNRAVVDIGNGVTREGTLVS